MTTIMATTTTTTTTTATTTPTATTTSTEPPMNAIAVELDAPDIRPHQRSSTGTDFVHTFESGKPGPHVLVNALTHGNEICGAIAVDRLLREGVRPTRGTLTLAFANVEAFSRFDRAAALRDALRRRGLQPRLDARDPRRAARTAWSSTARASCGRSSTRPTTSSTCTRCSSPARR